MLHNILGGLSMRHPTIRIDPKETKKRMIIFTLTNYQRNIDLCEIFF